MNKSSLVHLICPSGAVESQALDAGLKTFEELGFQGNVWPGAREKAGYFAGTHDARAQRLRDVLNRSNGPLWMIRGGYGAIHTLEQGMPLFEGHEPRELWGFSDGTALLAAWGREGWPVWHAPPITQLPRLDGASRQRLKRAFFHGDVPSFEALQSLNMGTARGHLAGGNLTVLASMVGTAHAADLRGSIVLFEDVGEPAYRVDRLVTQLRLSGAMDGIRGLVLGQFTNIPETELAKIRAFFVETSQSLNIPCAWGLPVGHGTANVPIPMGSGAGWSALLTAEPGASRLEFHCGV